MNKLVVVAGTNASGKSGLGIELACKYGAEIVSADSRQVLRASPIHSSCRTVIMPDRLTVGPRNWWVL